MITLSRRLLVGATVAAALAATLVPAATAQAETSAALWFTLHGGEPAVDTGIQSDKYTIDVYADADRTTPVQSGPAWVSNATNLLDVAPGDYVYCVVPTLDDQPYSTSCSGGTSDAADAAPVTVVAGRNDVVAELQLKPDYAGPRLRVNTSGGLPGVVDDGSSPSYPPLSGTLTRGRTLHVNHAPWSSDGAPDETRVVESVQWTRDGTPIAGATGRLYTLNQSDAGHTVGVSMQGSRSDRQDSAWTEVWSAPVGLTAIPISRTVTAATSHSNETHYAFRVALPERYGLDGVHTIYTWSVDGKAVSTATSFSTTAKGVVRLSVRATREGGYAPVYQVVTVRSSIAAPTLWKAASTSPVQHPLLRVPVGAVAVWQYVAQKYAYEPDSVTYEWQYAANGGWVTFATSRESDEYATSYEKLPSASLGHTIRVIVRAYSSHTEHGYGILTGGRVARG